MLNNLKLRAKNELKALRVVSISTYKGNNQTCPNVDKDKFLLLKIITNYIHKIYLGEESWRNVYNVEFKTFVNKTLDIR